MATAPIPFLDLASEWAPLRQAALERIGAILDHGRFVMGPEIEEFEATLAGDVGVAHAVACGSGTTALTMAMMALGVGPGDEVIVPAFTFAAPAECAALLGASPVFVDVDCPSGLIDPAAVEAAITARTKAIVAVSLYGQPADFAAINTIADKHGLAVIEDAAQSLGAMRGGRHSGALATIGCTSFFPTKVLGGAGDGGMVFTSDAEFAGRLAEIRNHGQTGRYDHARLGLNGRMSSIAAALLQLRREDFPAALTARRRIGERYDALLAPLHAAGLLDVSKVPPDTAPARANYTILVRDRDAVARALHEAGIGTAVHYPRPLHVQPAFARARRSGSLAGAERMAREALCLPIYPPLSEDSQLRIAGELADILGRM